MTAQPATTTVVNTLLECAQGKQDPEANIRLAENAVDSEISRLNTDPSYTDNLLQIVFPSGYPENSATLDKLFRFAHQITEFSAAEKVATCLLMHLLSKAGANGTQAILSSITETSNAHFWQNIRLLPNCLSKHILPPDFLSEWFLSCTAREGNDMAGGQAFELATEYADSHPDIGLEVIRQYMRSPLSGDRLTFSHVILGTIRLSPNLTELISSQVRQLDQDLTESTRIDWRVCFHRSWITTLRKRPFDSEHLAQRLSAMLAGTEEEVTSAFLVLSRSAYHFADIEAALSFAIDWLTTNTNNRISSEAKHHVVWLFHHLLTFDRIKPTGVTVAKLLAIIPLIYPVPLENKGTWELLLTFSLRCIPYCAPSDFVNFWTALVQQSPDKLLIEDLDYNADTMFWHHLKECCNIDVVTRLMFSRNRLARRYGRLFFDRLDITTFTPAVMTDASDRQSLITLLEFIRPIRQGKLLLRFFLAIAPRMTNSGGELLARFKYEVLRQIVNLPSSLLEPLKMASSDVSIFSDPVRQSEAYFERLQSTRDLPINFFHRHEIDCAVRLFNRKFDTTVRKGVEANSILMAIAGKPVTLLYGTSFANAYGGKLSDASSFQQFSHSMEWPRLPCLDPDGEALAEIQYASEIERLSSDECQSE